MPQIEKKKPRKREVERIISPMKPLSLSKKGLFFDSESGYEPSSSTTSGTGTPKDFFTEFLKVLPYLKEKNIQVKKVNNKLKTLSKYKSIPGPEGLEKITDPKVTQTLVFSGLWLINLHFQIKKKIGRGLKVVPIYIKSREELTLLEGFCSQLEELAICYESH